MPAKSKVQQKLMALALRKPEEVKAVNEKVLQMSKEDLKDFAKTPRKGLKEKNCLRKFKG